MFMPPLLRTITPVAQVGLPRSNSLHSTTAHAFRASSRLPGEDTLHGRAVLAGTDNQMLKECSILLRTMPSSLLPILCPKCCACQAVCLSPLTLLHCHTLAPVRLVTVEPLLTMSCSR